VGVPYPLFAFTLDPQGSLPSALRLVRQAPAAFGKALWDSTGNPVSFPRGRIADLLGDSLVYRNLRPQDPRLPGFAELREELGLRGELPRKGSAEYARVVVIMCAPRWGVLGAFPGVDAARIAAAARLARDTLGEAFDPERFSLSSWNVFPCPRPPLPAGGAGRRSWRKRS